MKPIFFSIVLPTYNRADMLPIAIDSVINQTYKYWELIIIDDGSTDNTRTIVSSYNETNIIYKYHENSGKGFSRNIGVEIASGDFICFLDSDDKYMPSHLEIFAQMIQLKPKYKLFRTGVIVYEDYEKPGLIQFQSKYMTEEDRNYQIRFIWNEVASLLELAIESTIAKAIKSTTCDTWQDKHYIIRLVLENPIKQINRQSVIVNDHSERSVRKNLQTKEQREAPYKCMDDLVSKYEIVSDIMGIDNITKMKIWSAYGQIYNLLADKQYKTAFLYHIELLSWRPFYYTIYKSIVLYYRIISNTLLSLLGLKRKYF